MTDENYKASRQTGLAILLNLKDGDRHYLGHTLKSMARSGLVRKLKGDRWTLPVSADFIVAKLRVHPRGFGTVLTESKPPRELHISKRNLNGAIDGDIVKVSPVLLRGRNGGYRGRKKPLRESGRVVEVLEREKTSLPGLFVMNDNTPHVIPDNFRISSNIRVSKIELDGITVNDLINHKVVIELNPPRTKRNFPEKLSGRVIEDIGMLGAPGVDVTSILREHTIDERFSADLEKATSSLSKTITDVDINQRTDLRALQTVTIDPENAKDFDDALSLEQAKDGNWLLYVHIADVARYVKIGSPIDIEARERGNSTYLVDRVIPMLPEHLTNNVCSLRPDVDSLTHTAKIKLSAKGEILESSTFRSIIHSDARLIYEQVQSFFDGSKKHGIDAAICASLKSMHSLSRILRKKRISEGSLDFTMPEVRCVLDDNGDCLDIVQQGGSEACQLVEEFMLVANQVVAKILIDDERDGIYRIHEDPDEDEWRELVEELRILGVTPLPHSFSEINSVIAKMSKNPGAHAFTIKILRSMKKAIYSTSPTTGHFGLGFEYYTHFTSPIRRYPDLIVHRLLTSIEDNDTSCAPDESVLKKIAKHCTDTEIKSQQAERESVDIKRISYFDGQLRAGKTGPHRGVVVSVIAKGLLIELTDSLQSGLLPFSAMRRDHFAVAKNGLSARGQRTGKVWKVGNNVNVRLSRVDLERRFVDFILA